jgi:hypothetical protein
MWTEASRGRMAEIEKKTKRYPTDMTDAERISEAQKRRWARWREARVESAAA